MLNLINFGMKRRIYRAHIFIWRRVGGQGWHTARGCPLLSPPSPKQPGEGREGH